MVNTIKNLINLNLLLLSFKRVFRKKLYIILFLLFIITSIIFLSVIINFTKSYDLDVFTTVEKTKAIILTKTIFDSIFIMLISFSLTHLFLFSDKKNGLNNIEIKAGIKIISSFYIRIITIFFILFSLILILFILQFSLSLLIPNTFKWFRILILNKFAYYLIAGFLTTVISFMALNFFSELLTLILAGVFSIILSISPLVAYFINSFGDNISEKNVRQAKKNVNNQYKFVYLKNFIDTVGNDINFSKSLLWSFEDYYSSNESIKDGNLLNDEFLEDLKTKDLFFYNFINDIHKIYETNSSAFSNKKSVNFNEFIFNKDNYLKKQNYNQNYFYDNFILLKKYNTNPLYNNLIDIMILNSKDFLNINSYTGGFFIGMLTGGKIDSTNWNDDVEKYSSIFEIAFYWFLAKQYSLSADFSKVIDEDENEELLNDLDELIELNSKEQLLYVKLNSYLNPFEIIKNLMTGSFYKEQYQLTIVNNLNEQSLVLPRQSLEIIKKENPNLNSKYNLINYTYETHVILNYEGLYFTLIFMGIAILILNYYKYKKMLTY